MQKQQQLEEQEAESADTTNQPDSRRRARKSNPALGSSSPTKRKGSVKRGAAAKKLKSESSDDDDDDDFGEVEIVEEKYVPGVPDTSNNDSMDHGEDSQAEDLDPLDDEAMSKRDARHREGTQRFNLRSAPKRNVNLPYPLLFITNKKPATPAILKTKRKSPEPPRNQIRLPDSLYPRRTRRRGPKDRKPRSKRYFVTRSRYGDRVINQTCNSAGCDITCDTVELYLEHKYLVHDESNFSFCRTCSQVRALAVPLLVHHSCIHIITNSFQKI